MNPVHQKAISMASSIINIRANHAIKRFAVHYDHTVKWTLTELENFLIRIHVIIEYKNLLIF